jgi:hypothetical protein
MEVSVTLAELAWSVREEKGLEPAAMVMAEAQAAPASFFSRVGVGLAATNAANAANLKEYFILLADSPCWRDWKVTTKRTIREAKECLSYT